MERTAKQIAARERNWNLLVIKGCLGQLHKLLYLVDSSGIEAAKLRDQLKSIEASLISAIEAKWAVDKARAERK